jgi:hypothetical protein
VRRLLLGMEVGKTRKGILVVVADQRAGWDFEATGMVSMRYWVCYQVQTYQLITGPFGFV